jgi:hypothetical protein
VSTIRGRAVRVGGVAVNDGAAGRTNPQTNATRPAFVIQAGIRKPTGGAGFATGGAGQASWFDPSQVYFWRLVAVGLALAYVVGFHVSLNGVRLGLGPGR